MKNKITFVTGGCKSGKSSHALHLAESYHLRKVFLATSIPFDDEMKDRISKHKKERDDSWETLDVPVLLPEAMEEHGQEGNVLLVDCLTLWINNLLMETENQDEIMARVDQLSKALASVPCPVVLVSNEVGCGIVPGNRLARLFRDVAGLVNQRVAEMADEVVWMVAGISNVLKNC